MADNIIYRSANKNDLPAIIDLLKNNDLPTADIETSNIDFLIAINQQEKIIGCIGVEKFGADALLRSFAVDASFRNQKTGSKLLERLIAKSAKGSINTLHLLTTTADKYFLSKGFSVAARDNAPHSIKSTAEFSGLCPSSSAYMVMTNIHSVKK